MDVHEWLNRLTETQLQAIKPVIGALDNLLSLSQGEKDSPKNNLAEEASTEAVDEPLSSLENYLEQALGMEDPQEIRDTVTKCLAIVKSEKVRLADAARIPSPATNPSIDSTTGLPSRLMFERNVADRITEGRGFLVALFIVERLAFINKRFGRSTGDRILLFVAQYLAQELPDSSSLSRWSGPAFAVALDSEFALKKKAVQLKAIASKPLSTNIDVGGRSIMISVSCSCLIETLSGDSSPEATFEKLDNFISANVSG